MDGQVAFSNARGNQIEAGVKAIFLDGRGTATLAAYRIVKKGLLAQRTLSSPVEQVGQRSAEEAKRSFVLCRDIRSSSGHSRGQPASGVSSWAISAMPKPSRDSTSLPSPAS